MSNHAQNLNPKEEALELLDSSILLTAEQKQDWNELINSMNDDELNKLLEILKDSEKGIEGVFAEAFEQDQDGVLIKKFKQFKSKALKEMDEKNQEQESIDADTELEESLKNL